MDKSQIIVTYHNAKTGLTVQGEEAMSLIFKPADLKIEPPGKPTSLNLNEGKKGLVSLISSTNSPELANNLYNSLKKSSPNTNFEVIWYWNGKSKDKPNKLPGKYIILPENEEFKYETAINQAISISSGEILLIANDDVTITCKNILEELLLIYNKYPKAGVIYGNLQNILKENSEINWSGPCWSIRRSAFDKMGGLDKRVTEYIGDEILTRIKMHWLGYESYRVPDWTFTYNLNKYKHTKENINNSIIQVTNVLGIIGLPNIIPQDQLIGITSTISSISEKQGHIWEEHKK